MTVEKETQKASSTSSTLSRRMRPMLVAGTVTLLTFVCLVAFLSPFAYMVVTSLKDREMLSRPKGPIWPAKEATYVYEGKEYPIMSVPTEDGQVHEWALVKKGREESQFIDPSNPEAGPIIWEGRWRTLEAAWEFAPQWGNFGRAWEELNFPRLLRNTLAIAILGLIGTLISCTLVAYGFSRFRFPGKNLLFMILISTIILPTFITLVPTYALFNRIGWVGTWLPLIVPHFFANAYNVFLLRQFFMTIPRDMDEAAMIDGAGPFRTLVSVILPQSVPALVAVALFHFMFAWNDFFMPLIYLSTARDLQPISIGIQLYNALCFAEPHMVQATALLGLLLPVALFFVAQRYFMRGIVFTGVEK